MVRDILRFHKLAEKAPTLAKPYLNLSEDMVWVNGLKVPSPAFGISPVVLFDRTIQFLPNGVLTDFLSNHKMLQAYNRPVWRVLKSSRTYVDKIVEGLGDRLHLSPVRSVRRSDNGVIITLRMELAIL